MQMARPKDELAELQTLVSQMPLHECCVMVVPEFAVPWKEVSKMIRNNRLPMVPASVARVLARHAARSCPPEEISYILQRLRLKSITIQERKWHIIDLLDPTGLHSVEQIVEELPGVVSQALRLVKKGNVRPEVHTLLSRDLVYMSVRLHTDRGAGPALFVCAPPGAPVAAASAPHSSLLPACVKGLGYQRYEDANLYGKDIHSLLRIHNKGWTANPEYLDEMPLYNPVPTITPSGIDYTHHTYNLNYVDMILGPDPPILTEVTIETTKPFFDPSRLNRPMNIKVQIKSEDIAKTLKSWVSLGALHPTSELFTIFTKVKGNRLQMDDYDNNDME